MRTLTQITLLCVLVVLAASVAAAPAQRQVATVEVPEKGYLSAAIYDQGGQHIRTLFERSPQSKGSVALKWDGRDDLGRLVSKNGAYTWKALFSRVETVEQSGIGDSQFTPLGDGNAFESNDQVDCIAVNSVGGVVGDVGGVFARNVSESSFGDTKLDKQCTLADAISASGLFYFASHNALTTDGELFVGHYSSSTAADRREFIGMEFQEGGNDGLLKVRARMYMPVGSDGAEGEWIELPTGGYFKFAYTYDPAAGKLTLNVSNEPGTYNHNSNAQVSDERRKSGATFDAFGMGIAAGAAGSSDPKKTAAVFIDDVGYTGHAGMVDFTKDPGWVGAGNTTGGNQYGWSASETADGSVYQASQGEEGPTLRRISTDSKPIWQQGGMSNIGIAANATHVFVSQWVEKKDRIIRLLACDGSYAPFARAAGGVIMVNTDEFDPRPKDQDRYTPDQYRQQFSLWAMAADSRRVWVSNYRKNRVEVYDAVTGLKLGEIPAQTPLGLAVEIDKADSGAVWVAHHADNVSRFTYTVKDGVCTFTEDAARRISNLREPSGLSIGGPERNLFVAERATGKVLEYDIRPTPPSLTGLKNTFGSLQRSGPMTENEFRWHRWAGVAVDHEGILNVVDDRRIQRFYTRADPKKGVAAGELYQSWWGEFGPAPIDSFNYTKDGKFTLVSGNYEYEVDPEYTGGPRKGWHNDGSWRVVSRFLDEGVGVRRMLKDGNTPREFRFVFNRSVYAYALEPDGPRMAAIVGGDWAGADLLGKRQGGLFHWIDNDGDGAIDWGGEGSGTSGEVVWNIPMGKLAPWGGLHAGWVDYAGNIWQIINRDIVMIPLEGFVTASNGLRNPKYNWANAKTIVPFQDDDWDFAPRFVRTAANGDIYSLGNSKFNGNLRARPGGSEIHGGDWIARYSPSGKRLLLRAIVDDNTDQFPPATAFDENDPKSQYFAVGNGEGNFFYIRLYTSDGLLVARASSEQGGIYTGWIDHQYGVGYVSHPVTKKAYLFGEDIVFGRSVRYRVDGLDTIQRKQGSFTWTTSNEVAGHWRFDDDANPPGAVGKAVQVGGSGRDIVELPFVPDPAAYTISAWIKPATATRGVNVICRASEKSGNQDMYQLRINKSGRFEHSIIDGADTIVAGRTAVMPDTWYHVTLTAACNGMMRLYVNGKEDGAARPIGSLSGAGDRFRLGPKSFSYGAFEGLVDDVRVYETVLDTAEIRSLYGQAAVVNVSASDPRAAETGEAGAFTISRSNTRGGLVVQYTLGGTAAAGSDFATVPATVTIPDGQSSATVAIKPVNDTVKDPGETVILSISPSTAYLSTTPRSATVAIADDDSAGDPGWVGVGNKSSGNGYGWSEATDHAGGKAGEIGGTFARNDDESYYADTNLAQSFTFDDAITASGKLTVFGQVRTDQEWVLGHISSDTADSSTLGIELMEGGDGSVKFAARAGSAGGIGSDSQPVGLPNGKYEFTYTYDPRLGNNGRVTVRIHNASYDQTASVDISPETRTAGATFDAFGIGIKNRPGTGDDAGKTIKMFIDDVTYSGSQK